MIAEKQSFAPGVVSVDSSRKTVQHLEGGIIRDIRRRGLDNPEISTAGKTE